jgi:hypothetical protein
LHDAFHLTLRVFAMTTKSPLDELISAIPVVGGLLTVAAGLVAVTRQIWGDTPAALGAPCAAHRRSPTAKALAHERRNNAAANIEVAAGPMPAQPQREAVPVLSLETARLIADLRGGASVCVDTNVWLDPEYHQDLNAFMCLLGQHNVRLKIEPKQHAELRHLRTHGATEELRSRAARVAHAGTGFAPNGSLALDTTIHPKRTPHLDDVIVKLAKGHLAVRRKEGRVIVSTDDVDLGTRLFTARDRMKAAPHQARVFQPSDL